MKSVARGLVVDDKLLSVGNQTLSAVLRTKHISHKIALINIECDINSINYPKNTMICANVIWLISNVCCFSALVTTQAWYLLATRLTEEKEIEYKWVSRRTSKSPWRQYFFLFIVERGFIFTTPSEMDELDHQKIFNKIIFKELEPCLLSEELIKRAVLEQGPKGEAGRLFKLMEIQYDKVSILRLEFLSLLKVFSLEKFN